MKYIRQFGWILLLSFIGEFLKWLLPLPVPASIYGLLLMLLALQTGILKLASVQDAAMFLIDIMPLMFIPAGVGLLESWGVLRGIWVPVVVIAVISTVLVMIVTGRVTQFVIRRGKHEAAGERDGQNE